MRQLTNCLVLLQLVSGHVQLNLHGPWLSSSTSDSFYFGWVQLHRLLATPQHLPFTCTQQSPPSPPTPPPPQRRGIDRSGIRNRLMTVFHSIYGCDGFFPCCKDLGGGGGGGRRFGDSFPTCAFSSFFVVVFFYMEISSSTLIPLFMPGSVHSSSASWDDCGRVFPDVSRVSSFP